MLELELCLALELRDDTLGQDLAQLDAPLVEGVDLPDRPLGEDTMLIEGHQLAERSRSEPFGEDRAGGAIALEDPVGDEPVRRPLGLDRFGCLAESQRLGLGEDVRQEEVVMPPEGIQRMPPPAPPK